ncbi:peptide ABC transporter permease [Bacillus canaveralius]|uniref:Peptide ABC transporter permease n=1 Tax=Bacillus canaveralius TaxID=1403243 RepID=A0A2N5GL71_9BACI|nr:MULTISPECIES: ABC transporter permease [Bacillus]PLR81246.1 peptide ABC transporter permease [Bacillus sp. V33-4]PLR82288.1 peptide ABC transporter permease [Bacillus canaveralius]PLR99475.1 peptide ABC transporter permease [Bacillus canaveralius]RSK49088.1 ABC transporter permease [Bacillus canaveralius]
MYSTLQRVSQRKIAAVGLFLLLIVIIIAVIAPLIVPMNPEEQNIVERLQPPGWTDEEGVKHWLGTDQLGRDVLSRVIVGSRVSIMVAAGAVIIGGTIGLIVGLVSGYSGGWIDSVLMRIVDMQLAFPFLLLALTMVTILGPSVMNVVLVLSVTSWISYAKVVRSSVLSIKHLEFIEATRAIGASRFTILFRHILPNIISPFIVVASFQVATLIIAESSLSFLGLGVPASQPTWGGMLADGREYMSDAWWIAVFPGMMLMVVAMSANLFGDGLRDALDPR